jgi:hypothetical protein
MVANGKIIAAAPEMLEALKLIMEHAENGTPIRPGAEVLIDISTLITKIKSD